MKSKNKLATIICSSIAILLSTDRTATALNFTLFDGFNGATYDNQNDFGFIDWQVDGNRLLTQSGWFYRVGNSGMANSIATLTASNFTNNSNSATVTYTAPNFAVDLQFALTNSGATLNRSATVRNTSSTALDFYLYSYHDLNTSTGNGGDSVTINSSDHSTTQSGNLTAITTTIDRTIIGSNTTLNYRAAEADIIDAIDDTLFDNLLDLSGTTQLNNHLTATADNDPISFAYEWNYNLGSNESFRIATSSTNTAAVPFDFSPSLGLMAISIGAGSYYLKKRQLKM